jgi:hypothetical protein
MRVSPEFIILLAGMELVRVVWFVLQTGICKQLKQTIIFDAKPCDILWDCAERTLYNFHLCFANCTLKDRRGV